MYRVITAARATSVQDDIKSLASKLWEFIDDQYDYAREHNFSISELRSKAFRRTLGGKKYVFRFMKGILEVSSESGQVGRWNFRDGYNSYEMQSIAETVLNDARFDEIDYMDRKIRYSMAGDSYGFTTGSLSPNQILKRWIDTSGYDQCKHQSGDRSCQYWGLLGSRSYSSHGRIDEFFCSDDSQEVIDYLDSRMQEMLDAEIARCEAEEAKGRSSFDYAPRKFNLSVLDTFNSKEIYKNHCSAD